MNTKPHKLALAGLFALALSGTALAGDFWSSPLSIQGKTLDLGDAGRTTSYAVFVTNGTFSASTNTKGEVDVTGDVGVYGSSLSLSGSVINGNAGLKTGGTFNVTNSGQITGSRLQSSSEDAKLASGVSAAATFSSTAGALSATTNYTASSSISSGNVILNSQSLTVDDTNNAPVVLKLSTFSLNNSTLTLEGSASAMYIIDVSGSFNLANASNIILTGGLTAGDVVFNYTGSTNAVGISSSTLNGILLADNATVSMSGPSLINGELIAKSVNLSGGSKVNKPKAVSP